ncbi:MAG: preprotein translocase subunit YajC [Clostridia bacterium]|nr:preprotein translocase subunit YajC [Clostridia bacterium]MBQ7047625.1 preprotein translocase subunit YajC [Clostridia bacterium]
MGNYGGIITIVVFVVVGYFFLIRPENKRKKEATAMRDSLKVGDTVITIGGITGEVESIRKETITIFTGDGSIDLQKWAIRSVEPEVKGTVDGFTYSEDELDEE